VGSKLCSCALLYPADIRWIMNVSLESRSAKHNRSVLSGIIDFFVYFGKIWLCSGRLLDIVSIDIMFKPF